ncbi:hypothetical protein BJV82DRAFT_619362 [Fennellomyces sp. T-0311]|nr:hypothetical protein BJV82DRAFT_619362 [Fennellomyces sp. T-0311]
MSVLIQRSQYRIHRNNIPLFMVPLLLLTFLVMSNGVYGYYPMDTTTQTQIPKRSNAASFVLDNRMYFYGGEGRGADNATRDFFSVGFDGNGVLNYRPVPISADPGPRVAGARAVILPDNNTVLLFGGFAPDFSSTTETQLLSYQYTFDDQVWAPIPLNVTGDLAGGPALPTHRESHSVTLGSDGLVYIFGGIRSVQDPTLVGDFWAYDPNTRLFSRRELMDNLTMFGHSAIALPNGSIFYTAGLNGYAGNTTTSTGSGLTEAHIGLLYITGTQGWEVLILGADPPEMIASVSSRIYPTAVLGPEGRYIYFFGGSNLDPDYNRKFRYTLSILDTETWNYTVPVQEGTRPNRRAMASAGIISNEYMVVGLGGARGYHYGDINVMQLPTVDGPITPESTVRWVSNATTGAIDERVQTSESISRGIIAAVVIVCVLAAAMLVFLAWRFRHRIHWLMLRIHNDFWNPRTGEPFWAEAARLVSKIILAFLFVAFFAFVLIQVLQSPKATFTITETAPMERVNVPEIRFCFDGYPESPALNGTYPLVSCITDSGEDCNSYLVRLDLTEHQPFFFSNLGAVSCYLFLPDDLQLALNSIPGSNNGSLLHFALQGSPAETQEGRTHITFYAPGMNPNREFYFSDGDRYYKKQLLTQDQISDWLIADANDYQSDNIVDVQTNDAAFVHYQLQDYQHLQNNGWNFVGFSPVLNTTPQVEITKRVQAMNLERYSPPNGQLNEIMVLPASFTTVRIREQKIYSLLNALGFLGGLFGLFVAFQALIFGHRPNSPWGIIHRWSVGNMKRSLSRELTSRFDVLKTPVPLMNPVHRRFSLIDVKNYGPRQVEDNNYLNAVENGSLRSPHPMESEHREEDWSDRQRIEQVEERMQLLELVFKSYYIDDEVFRRLDRALKRPSIPTTSPIGNQNGMTDFFGVNGARLRSRTGDAHENSSRNWLGNGGHSAGGPLEDDRELTPPYVPRLASPPPPPLPNHGPDDDINHKRD